MQIRVENGSIDLQAAQESKDDFINKKKPKLKFFWESSLITLLTYMRRGDVKTVDSLLTNASDPVFLLKSRGAIVLSPHVEISGTPYEIAVDLRDDAMIAMIESHEEKYGINSNETPSITMQPSQDFL